MQETHQNEKSVLRVKEIIISKATNTEHKEGRSEERVEKNKIRATNYRRLRVKT